MNNKSVTARNSRPQRSNRSIRNNRPSSQSKPNNHEMTIPYLKWRSNYSTGLGILPVGAGSYKPDLNKENKINESNHKRRYRSGSRARYQRSMQGSGIADLMNYDSKKDHGEIKVNY